MRNPTAPTTLLEGRTLSLRRKVRVPVFLRMLVPPLFYFVWKLLRRFLRPDFVFMVYGSSSDRSAYLPPAKDSFFPPVFPIGIIRRGKRWGLVGATVLTIRDLTRDNASARKLLEDIRKAFPKARSFALAGQLPGLFDRKCLPLAPPFVRGVYGTIYAMVCAARNLAEKVGKPPSAIRLALLGAGGTIGAPLTEQLCLEFKEVIAFDPRFRETRRTGNVVKTYDNSLLSGVDAILVLTAKGDDIQAYSHFFPSGAHIADDTHPCMSPDLVHQLRNRGLVVWKATTKDAQLRMYPRLPNFRPDDTPGCLLEAVVSVIAGEEALRGQEAFSKAAAGLGFEARLAPHPDA